MSQEAVKDFFDFAKTSEEVQLQLKNGVSYEGIIKIASEKGYNFTEKDLQKHITSLGGQEELSEQELEAVAGGNPILIGIIIGLLLARK
jgi:predicted ribosomally synthesized peptide with nif11-like leader